MEKQPHHRQNGGAFGHDRKRPNQISAEGIHESRSFAPPPFQLQASADVPPETPPETLAKEAPEPETNANGLPVQLQRNMEALTGVDLSDTVVQRQSAVPGTMNAHATAQGNRIDLAAGQEQHLPHELAHVAQQKQGRVVPTAQLKAAAINDDPALESEADALGAKAMSMAPVQRMPMLTKNGSAPPVIQRIKAQLVPDYDYVPEIEPESDGERHLVDEDRKEMEGDAEMLDIQRGPSQQRSLRHIKIVGLTLSGRPKRRFGTTSGDHLTSFGVFEETVRRRVEGRGFYSALTSVRHLFEVTTSLAGYRHLSREKKRRVDDLLRIAETNYHIIREKMDGNRVDQAYALSLFQGYIEEWFEIREKLHMTTFNTRDMGLEDFGTNRGEQAALEVLRAVEMPSDHDDDSASESSRSESESPEPVAPPQEILDAVVKTFDHHAFAISFAIPGELAQSCAPGVILQDFDRSLELAMIQHTQSLGMAFPEMVRVHFGKLRHMQGFMEVRIRRKVLDSLEDQFYQGISDTKRDYIQKAREELSYRQDSEQNPKPFDLDEGFQNAVATLKKIQERAAGLRIDIPDEEIELEKITGEVRDLGKRRRKGRHQKLDDDTLEANAGFNLDAPGNDGHDQPERRKRRDGALKPRRKKRTKKRKPRDPQSSTIRLNEAGEITDVKFEGRPASPFGKTTMGAHSSAWCVRQELIRRKLRDNTPLEGFKVLDQIVRKAYNDNNEFWEKFGIQEAPQSAQEDAKMEDTDTPEQMNVDPVADSSAPQQMDVDGADETAAPVADANAATVSSSPATESRSAAARKRIKKQAKMSRTQEKKLLAWPGQKTLFERALLAYAQGKPKNLQDDDPLLLLRLQTQVNRAMQVLNFQYGVTINTVGSHKGRGEGTAMKRLRGDVANLRTDEVIHWVLKLLDLPLNYPQSHNWLLKRHWALIREIFPDVARIREVRQWYRDNLLQNDGLELPLIQSKIEAWENENGKIRDEEAELEIDMSTGTNSRIPMHMWILSGRLPESRQKKRRKPASSSRKNASAGTRLGTSQLTDNAPVSAEEQKQWDAFYDKFWQKLPRMYLQQFGDHHGLSRETRSKTWKAAINNRLFQQNLKGIEPRWREKGQELIEQQYIRKHGRLPNTPSQRGPRLPGGRGRGRGMPVPMRRFGPNSSNSGSKSRRHAPANTQSRRDTPAKRKRVAAKISQRVQNAPQDRNARSENSVTRSNIRKRGVQRLQQAHQQNQALAERREQRPPERQPPRLRKRRKNPEE